ncbi:hypothetical protein KK062_22450 [Fulvivirgaceae bacterium PWU5]|uniref:Uncharacterized protein n=1 Tax=Dawidia cretensis TaxID=2782350 RepID=A0AAP2E0X7_9BACT|nr:hypothetical protein [Dawidia cretensis]MBT1711021.1 hypothetical protein [Dawidia cretensis]
MNFIIRAKLNEIPIKGISVSAISKNTLFVITFLSTPEKFESFMEEYRKAMNSLVLNCSIYITRLSPAIFKTATHREVTN